jgi:hypothetical protein
VGALLSGDQVTREDLSPALELFDMRNTPVVSRMKKGSEPDNTEYSWTLDQMGNRRTDGVQENKDVDAFEGDSQGRAYNRVQRFWRTPRVSVESEKLVKNADQTKGRYRKQVTKKVGEQKRDIEARLQDDLDSTDDTGVVGRRFKGLGNVISAGDGTAGNPAFTDAPMTIPGQFRTPKAQIFSDVIANFDETKLTDMLQSRYDMAGVSVALILFVASSLKRRISDYFGKYARNVANYTTILRTQLPPVDAGKYIMQGVDEITGDFGSIEVVLSPFAPTNYRGYGLDMDQIELRPLMYCDHTELPYQGGGRSGLIDSILGYEYGDPRAHIKIAPSDETARDLGGK